MRFDKFPWVEILLFASEKRYTGMCVLPSSMKEMSILVNPMKPMNPDHMLDSHPFDAVVHYTALQMHLGIFLAPSTV